MTGVCLLCGYTADDLDVLDDHVDSHLREPDGTCPMCGAGVRQPCECWNVQAVPA